MTRRPRKSVPIGAGRTPDGRFALGNPGGPGRPPVPDFRRVIAERLAANGGSVDGVLFEVFEALRSEAAAGNVAAAKVLLDRLAPERVGVPVHDLEALLAETAAQGPDLDPHQRAVRLAEILRDGRRRIRDAERPNLTVVTAVPAAAPAGAAPRTLSPTDSARSERAEATNDPT